MQPTFLPWMGYFELILKADVFIFLDDFQYSARSYHQRNRLFVNTNQVDWYTVPVIKEKSFEKSLNEVQIDNTQAWERKFLKRIERNYCKAKYYDQMFPILEQVFQEKNCCLGEMNIKIIKLLLEKMQIETAIRCSTEFVLKGKRSEKILELLRLNEGTIYYSAQGSFEYMLEDNVFPTEDIEVYFQNFKPKEYPQIGNKDGFISHLSVIDAIMNIGFHETRELIEQGTQEWLTWEKMKLNKI